MPLLIRHLQIHICPILFRLKNERGEESSNNSQQEQTKVCSKKMEDSLDELLELLQQEADVDIGVASTVASDLLEQHTSTQHGGSPKGKAPNKSRDFDEAYKRLVRNYFDGENSIYDEADFERRFRLPRAVFNQIYNQLYGSGCFTQHYMLDGRPGINPLVRLVACFRKIAYGDADDREDENLCLSESVLHESFEQFLSLIKQHFAKDYLNRQPSSSEKEHALKKNAARNFPGCFASWDCKHFNWENCPKAWEGQFRGKEGVTTLVLEAICDPDLYIWFFFFGQPGTLNDINILDKSSIVGAMVNGSFDFSCPAPYKIGPNWRDYMYFLVDGIYPDWSIFIDSCQGSDEEKLKYFSSCQEAVRKDIERCFGVLVKRFHILKRPLRFWTRSKIGDVLDCCIILHNMCVEHGRGTDPMDVDSENMAFNAETDEVVSLFGAPAEEVGAVGGSGIQAILQHAHLQENIQDSQQKISLKGDLIEHAWSKRNG